MSKLTLIEQLRGYKSTPRHCEELCYEAANEIESMIHKLIVAHEESEFDHSEYKRLREDLRQQLAEALVDVERYRWLRERLFGADLDWNGEGVPVILFRWPESASIGANLDAAIDAAMKPKEQWK